MSDDTQKKRPIVIAYVAGLGLLAGGLTHAHILGVLGVYPGIYEQLWTRVFAQLIGLLLIALALATTLKRKHRGGFLLLAGLAIGWLILQPGYYRAVHGPLANTSDDPIALILQMHRNTE